MKRKILILDSKEEYPNIKYIIKFFESNESLDLVDSTILSEEEIKELVSTNEDMLVFSYLPENVSQFINRYPETLPYFTTLDKNIFREIYEDFKEVNKDLFVPKVMISSGKPLDLLEVSSLFQRSEIKSLKYINGSSTPIIIEFEGLTTFNYLNNLESGVLVPATIYDSISESSSQQVSKNKKWILQKLELEDKKNVFISYSVKYNLPFGLVWTEIENIDTLDETLNSIKVIPELEECNFYLEIEKNRGKFYINKIFQGIHPYIIF